MGFVKTFFKDSWLFLLLCSRHNPSFLQLNGSGSHLYPPNLHTLGSRQSVETERGKSYIALVGFGSSPLLSLTSFVSLLYHRGSRLSRTFSYFFQLFFGVDSPSSWAIKKVLKQTFEPYCHTLCRDGLQGLLLYSPVLCWYLYYSRFGVDCQDLFWIFSKNFFQPWEHLDTLTHSAGFRCEFYQPLPYCSYSIPHHTSKVNTFGKNKKIIILRFSLDKNAGVWYNGKFRAHRSCARRWNLNQKNTHD